MTEKNLSFTFCETWAEVLSLDMRGEAAQTEFGCWDMPDARGDGGVFDSPKHLFNLLMQMMIRSPFEPDDCDQMIVPCPTGAGWWFITPAPPVE